MRCSAAVVVAVLVGFVAASVVGPGFAKAAGEQKCAKGDYDDTKHRFCIHLESGWQLAPMPGDTSGMIFKKVVDGVPGILRVSIRDIKAGETPKQTLDDEEAGAKAELGYKAGSDTPTSIGLLPRTRRTFSVFASGDGQRSEERRG